MLKDLNLVCVSLLQCERASWAFQAHLTDEEAETPRKQAASPRSRSHGQIEDFCGRGGGHKKQVP